MADQVEQRRGLSGPEPGDRIVEQEEARAVGQGQGQVETAARRQIQLVDTAFGMGEQADAVEMGIGLAAVLTGSRSPPSPGLATHDQECELDGFPHGHGREAAGAADRPADA